MHSRKTPHMASYETLDLPIVCLVAAVADTAS